MNDSTGEKPRPSAIDLQKRSEDIKAEAALKLPHTNHPGEPMPGEGASLHPDDAKAMKERDERNEASQSIKGKVAATGVPGFQDVEPPGGYDTNHEPGDPGENPNTTQKKPE